MQQNPDAKNEDKKIIYILFCIDIPVLMFFFMYTIWIRSYSFFTNVLLILDVVSTIQSFR